MNEKEFSEASLLHKAMRGTILPSEVVAVAAALGRRDCRYDLADLVHILGEAGATEYEALVASFLKTEDAILVRAALETLSLHWDVGPRHRHAIYSLAQGVEWDPDGWVRQGALHAAGHCLAFEMDKELLDTLVRVAANKNEAPSMREAAYVSLQRAAGVPVPQLRYARDIEAEEMFLAEVRRLEHAARQRHAE